MRGGFDLIYKNQAHTVAWTLGSFNNNDKRQFESLNVPSFHAKSCSPQLLLLYKFSNDYNDMVANLPLKMCAKF